jgi:hypothetical protein
VDLSYITFVLFAAFSSLRMVSYLPQIYKVATDKNGASAISYSTWGLWIAANVTTGLYAFNNLNDHYLAGVSAVYAVCCMAVIGLTMVKRRRHQSNEVAATVAFTRATWLRPVYGLVVASILAVGIGFGTRWVLTSPSPVPSEAATSSVAIDLAVADTPFDDEPSTPRAKVAEPFPGSSSMREARVSPQPATRFEATYQPKNAKGRQ